MNGSANLVILEVVALGIALLLDFLFSIALAASSSLNRVTLHLLEADLSDDGRLLRDLKSPVSRHRTAAFFARQTCLLGSCALIALIGTQLGWPMPWLLAIVAGSAGIVLVLETLLARIVAAHYARTALRRLIPVMEAARILTFPILFPIQFILEKFGTQESTLDDQDEEVQGEAVQAYFEAGEREGIMEADEGRMMRSIVDLGDTRVREIMTPRTDIEALALESTVGDARRILLKATHSGLPVYKGSLDSTVGVLHIRDLMRAWESGGDDEDISGYLRPAFFIPESQMVDDLLEKLQTTSNMALVVDEYGGIAGLVTIEDILEEIVGDIRDEHDAEEESIRRLDDHSWRVNGLVHVGEIEELFGIQIEDREFDTVGGLVVARMGLIPETGQTLMFQGLEITVVKSDSRRVYEVRIREVGNISTDPAEDA
jgi:putative hemolysin